MDKQVWGKVGESGSAFGKGSMMKAMGYIPMQDEPPSVNHVAKEDGTWEVSVEKLGELYAADLATLDPLLSHVYRHDFNGEYEEKARAELEFQIAQSEIMEKYGKGSTVFISENGTCYHADEKCSHIGADNNNLEINLSDGLKNYTACSVCVG